MFGTSNEIFCTFCESERRSLLLCEIETYPRHALLWSDRSVWGLSLHAPKGRVACRVEKKESTSLAGSTDIQDISCFAIVAFMLLLTLQ